ncbi:hypothetical protein K2Z83_08430 [Oscillochloris sp. ZM17-4]|uniref:hypothetical protein n=1 Tax=Oscillochloris sp. ZM17-4 TaxID=2866714 RepID=UPI001C72C4E7|nr:hypothetical protein [Oscillochloris sp. ZM17-4]MBX0327702.1 hypothetical protein [Oscillochloris sp. ZM17-4]
MTPLPLLGRLINNRVAVYADPIDSSQEIALLPVGSLWHLCAPSPGSRSWPPALPQHPMLARLAGVYAQMPELLSATVERLCAQLEP